MEILLALICGAAGGTVLHVLMTGRAARGAALAPMLGALVGSLAWLAFTWAGATTTSPWIWLVSVAAPLVIVPCVLLVLTRVRAARDARERLRLRIS